MADGSLAQLIITALERNPEIQAAEESARAAAARVPQATSLADPVVSAKVLPEPIRTAEGDNYFVLGVRQTLPVPEKLDRRGRIALQAARMAVEQVAQIRVRVIADVKRAYFQLYAIDKTTEITRQNQTLLRDLIEVTRRQVESGRPQEDLLRAQVEHSNLETELIRLRQRRASAAAMINALLDRRAGTSIPTPPDFDARQSKLHLERLFEHAAKHNPELRRLAARIQRDEQGLALAKLAYWPDFTLGFEWIQMDPRAAFRPPVNPDTGMRPRVPERSEDGSDNWALTLAINLPIWFERIEAAIREARHQSAASRRALAAAKNMVLYRVQDALERVAAQRDLAELFTTTIIPQAEQAYDVARAGYIAGTSDFQHVIDNWQKWLMFRIQLYRALSELERSIADLEQAVGVSVMDSSGSDERATSEP